MNVRAHLVDPILDALGWMTENPNLVRYEQSTESGGKPDYELFGSDKKRVLYVEAKALGADLVSPARDKPLYQLSEYLFQQGVGFGILTDGAVWVLLRAFTNKPLSERIVWRVDIHEEYPSMENLLQIKPDRVEKLEEVGNKHKLVVSLYRDIMQNPQSLVNALLEAIKRESSEKGHDLSLDEIERFSRSLVNEFIEKIQEDGKEPSDDFTPTVIPKSGEKYEWVQIGETRKSIANNKEILTETAEWLIRKGYLKPKDAPISKSKNKYLIAEEPKHPSPDRRGNYGFRGAKKLSNGLWMHTNFSTEDYIRWSRFLLERFGVSPNDLKFG